MKRIITFALVCLLTAALSLGALADSGTGTDAEDIGGDEGFSGVELPEYGDELLPPSVPEETSEPTPEPETAETPVPEVTPEQDEAPEPTRAAAETKTGGRFGVAVGAAVVLVCAAAAVTMVIRKKKK